MYLIVGLGNPGKKFKNTRHNLGFKVIAQIKERNNFPDFKFSKKDNALISKKDKVILAKPQTFMNNSGKAVQLLVTGYGLPVTNLFVIHDDLDLNLGSLKIVKNRGSGGHKGVESIIKEIGKDFVRFRLGIKNNNIKNKKKFVLNKFNKEEQRIIKKVIRETVEAIDFALEQGIEKAMSRYNK